MRAVRRFIMMVCILSQMNPIHTLKPNLRSSLIDLPWLRSFRCFLLFSFRLKYSLISHLCHACYMTHAPYPRFSHTKTIWPRVRIIRILDVQSSLTGSFCCLLVVINAQLSNVLSVPPVFYSLQIQTNCIYL